MVTDDDYLEKDDIHILDRMKEMLQNEEVMRLAAAKQLMVLIERVVRCPLLIRHFATTKLIIFNSKRAITRDQRQPSRWILNLLRLSLSCPRRRSYLILILWKLPDS